MHLRMMKIKETCNGDDYGTHDEKFIQKQRKEEEEDDEERRNAHKRM